MALHLEGRLHSAGQVVTAAVLRNASPPAVLPNLVKIGRLFQKCSGAPEDNTISLHLRVTGRAAR